MDDDVEKAHTFAAELEAGTVWINCYNKIHESAPFGGYKQSGNGREKGMDGYNEFRQTKSVVLNIGEWPEGTR